MSQPELLTDRLEEAARNGSERAGEALSMLLGRPIDVVHRPARVIGGAADAALPVTEPGAAVGRLSVAGGSRTGEAVVCMAPSSWRELLATHGIDAGVDGALDDMALSMLREASNITAASYLNSLADAWDIELLPSPVDVTVAHDVGPLVISASAGIPALMFECGFTSEHGSFAVTLVTRIDLKTHLANGSSG